MSQIIEVGPAHAAVMATIHAAAFPPGARWGPDAITLQLGLSGAFGHLALDSKGLPGGFILARVAADEAEILTLAVAPPARRNGLATALLHAAETRAEIAGATAMFLEVADANAPARSLYARRGYVQVGLRRGYYAGGEDALVLRRKLGPCELSPGAATAR